MKTVKAKKTKQRKGFVGLAIRKKGNKIMAISWNSLEEVIGVLAKEINKNAHEKGFWPLPCKLCGGKGFVNQLGVAYYNEGARPPLYCFECKGTGWQDGKPPRSVGDTCALLHSEISEMFEGFRHGNKPSEHIKEFSSMEEEAADEFIRLLDECHERGLRLVEAIKALTQSVS